MLVLTRKTGQEIVARLPSGELIKFTILEVDGRKVSVGITAPKELPVHRREVWERIKTTA